MAGSHEPGENKTHVEEYLKYPYQVRPGTPEYEH